MENLELCDCGKVAVWCYMPGFQDGNSFVCDDCISSTEDVGCSCNWHYSKYGDGEQPEGIEGKDWRYVEHAGSEHMGEIKKEKGIWVNLDDRGRPYPCAEYWHSKEGFEKD